MQTSVSCHSYLEFRAIIDIYSKKK
jgi:hypothetical protein